MPKIRVLDQDTANKIAAGEVIERPHSVVKELVENALDAGANRIAIDIKDGGTAAITVSDNGCGIEREDAPLAFLRHATSKIKQVEDLFSITTLGFRGEALPSIASVAKVTMLTRTADSDVGVKLQLEGGTLISSEPVGCPVGTKITVSDLFYNTPARKKHLKGTAAEAALISELVSRLALSRSDVAIKLTSQNRVLVETPGSGKLLDAFAAVNGVQAARKMIPVEGQIPGIYITGYVSKPELNRATRSHQTIFVNGRYVKSKLISDALKDGYHTLMSYSRHPLAVLAVEISPGMVDVNVHPAKMEVRISHERELKKLITGMVQKAVRTPVSVPQIEQPPVKKSPSLNLRNEEINYRTAAEKPMLEKTIEEPSKNVLKEQQQLYLKQAELPLRVTHEVPTAAADAADYKPEQVLNEANNHSAQSERFPELVPLGQLMPTNI